MKKLITIFISFTLLSFLALGQNIAILDHSGSDVSNDTIIHQSPTTSDEITQELSIVNNNTGSIEIMVRKVEVELVSGTMNYFCLNQCYPSNIYESTSPITIAAGATLDGTAGFSYHYFANSIDGTTMITYTFYDNDNPGDSVQVTVKFVIGQNSIDETFIANSISDIYPNPATDILNIDYNVNTNSSLKIYNLIGSEIKTVSLSNSASKASVNVSDLVNGVYFYSFISKSNILKQGRFVINR